MGAATGTVRRVLVAVLLATGLSAATSTPAPAATFPPTPSGSWGVNARVYATQIVGDTVFVGGDFTAAVAPDGSTVARRHLAAFDVRTGALLPWRADADGSVRALTAQGGWLYAGGAFNNVDGQRHRKIARVDVSTGDTDPGFHPSFSNTVRSVAVTGDDVYAGGYFGRVDGRSVTGIALVDADTGLVRPSFSLRAARGGGRAPHFYGLALSPDRDTLYVAGAFNRLGGASRRGVGAVDAATGAVRPVVFQSSVDPTLGLAISDDGSVLYGAGGGYPPTGNTLSAWRTSSGTRSWHVLTRGDIQAVDYFDGQVFFGFHEGIGPDRSARLLAADGLTGRLDADFRPRFDRWWGVFAVDASPRGLAVGGDFTVVSGVRARFWARFPSANPETQPDPAPDPEPDPDPAPPPPPDGWTRIGAGSTQGISGMTPTSSGWLIVRDNKLSGQNRLALLGADLGVTPLTWTGPRANDLESIDAIPGVQDRYITCNGSGHCYNVRLVGTSATVTDTFDLPAGSDQNEALAMVRDGGSIVAIWADRGSGSRAARLYGAVFDVARGTFGSIASAPVTVPWPTTNVRSISDATIVGNRIVITSGADNGDNGPFDSAVYEIGTVSASGSSAILSLHAPTSRGRFPGHKIEGIACGSEHAPGIVGTDDENLGGFVTSADVC